MGRLANAYRALAGRPIKTTDSEFWQFYFGGDTITGKSINAQTALQIGTVWACVRLISETVATLPLGLYERDGQNRKKRADGHSLYEILHDQPNADMTAVEFWELVVAHTALWGNHYSEKTVSAGRVRSLQPLNPELMDEPRVTDSGGLIYPYNGTDGFREYTEDEIFHVKGFGVSGRVGLSVIGFARHTFGMAIAAEESAGKMFANGMNPSGVVKASKVLKKEQRDAFRKGLKEFESSENSGKTLLLEDGWDYQQVSMKPEDAQLLQSRAFNVEEICRWFRVPPNLVGHTEKSTSWGTGLEQQNIAFLTYSLRPYLMRIEQAVRRCLIPRSERGKYYAEFNLEGLLRADSSGRAQLYSQYAQNGVMTRNEMRGKENLPPMEGGDELTVQSNMIPLSQLGAAVNDSQKARAALKAWLEEDTPHET